MKEITLTQGKVALVDDGDYEWLSRWKWYAWWNPKTRSFYAVRTDHPYRIYMHRAILGLTKGDGLKGDHVEPSRTLDNRRENLRIATTSQNGMNSRRGIGNSSGYKGVSFDRSRNQWMACIKVNYKNIFLGRFGSPELAYMAYCTASKKIHGEFGRLA